MSVVNKMLQDLEARQSHTDDLNADYQPPQKKQSKLLVLILLILAIAAIIFALADKNKLFDKIADTEGSAVANTPAVLPAVIKKMTVASKKMQLEPQTASAKPLKAAKELVNTETDVALTTPVLANQKILLQEPTITTNELASLQNADTNKPLEAQDSAVLNTQATPESKPSFSMTGSSQEDNTNNLKQRISESLNNNNLDLALPLLNELLEIEPDNIKARKKLASLLFAQGDYARSKQLLLQGIALHPAQSDLRLMLARLYVVQKKPSLAMNILAEFQPDTNNQTEYLAYRAALAQQLKQTKLAKSDYQTLTNIDSTNAKWWLGLAIARDQLGETSMAVQAYRRASSLGQLDDSVADFIQQRISVLAGAQ